MTENPIHLPVSKTPDQIFLNLFAKKFAVNDAKTMKQLIVYAPRM